MVFSESLQGGLGGFELFLPAQVAVFENQSAGLGEVVLRGLPWVASSKSALIGRYVALIWSSLLSKVERSFFSFSGCRPVLSSPFPFLHRQGCPCHTRGRDRNARASVDRSTTQLCRLSFLVRIGVSVEGHDRGPPGHAWFLTRWALRLLPVWEPSEPGPVLACPERDYPALRWPSCVPAFPDRASGC
jgi:hypothetical protein